MQDFSQIKETLTSGRDWLNWSAEQFGNATLFYGHGTADPIGEALALVMHVQNIQPHEVDDKIDRPVSLEDGKKIYEVVNERIKSRKPLPYLIGEAWFAGLKFKVDERVLVPRSPFAELIMCGFTPWLDSSKVNRVLDMCTGSGCIAIATALNLEHVTVDAVDISDAALDLAGENISLHGVEDKVHLVQSDGFVELETGPYDLVLCNPPYVDRFAMHSLPDEYRYEPELGLAAGDDGLDFVRQFMLEVPSFLTDNASVFVEVGASAAAMELAYQNLPLTWLELEQGGDGIFMLAKDDFQIVSD